MKISWVGGVFLSDEKSAKISLEYLICCKVVAKIFQFSLPDVFTVHVYLPMQVAPYCTVQNQEY